MNRFCSVVLTAVALVVAIGCTGSPGIGVKDGDKLIVAEKLERERFDASYGEDVKNITHTNGAFIEIPEGTVLEVFVTPRPEARTIEVRPIKAINPATGAEVTNAEDLTIMFVQDRYRTHDFLYYTISLPVEYLGSKIKKME